MDKNNKEIININRTDFNEILDIIQKARERTFRAVNHEFISMYWKIGKYVNAKVNSNVWGKSVVSEFSNFVQQKHRDMSKKAIVIYDSFRFKIRE